MKQNKINQNTINYFLSSLAILSFIFGIIWTFINKKTSTDILYSISLCNLGIVVQIGFILLIKKLRFNFPIYFSIFFILFTVMALLFGETFDFYEKYKWWDDVEHFISSFFIFTIGISLIYLFNPSIVTRHIVVSIIAALTFCIAASAIWEMLEFGMDCLFHFDFQKTLPPFEPLYNGGSTSLPLFGSIEEIGVFYKNPSGYRYAIMDTMTDMLEALCSALIGCVLYYFCLRHEKLIPSFIITRRARLH